MTIDEIKLKLAARARALRKARECINTTIRVNETFKLDAFTLERIAELQAVAVILSRAEQDCYAKYRITQRGKQ